MQKVVPHEDAFKKALSYDKRHKQFQYGAAAISLIAGIVGLLSIQSEWLTLGFSVISLLCTLMVTFYDLRFIQKYREAETTRRDTIWDNAFNTKMAGQSSVGYYDTDDVETGFKKLLANLHENSFFSAKISEKMIEKAEVKTIISVIVVLAIAILNLFGTMFVVTVADVFLSLSFAEDLMELKRFYAEANKVQENCRVIWEKLANDSGAALNAEIPYILRNFTRYETALAYDSILLDSEIYNQLNAELTEQFNSFKADYKMN